MKSYPSSFNHKKSVLFNFKLVQTSKILRYLIVVCLIVCSSTNVVFAQYSGTYVVDPAGLGNFITINEAVDSLQSQGVSGPTTIALKSHTYHENIELTGISGLSATNTLTFKSEIGNRDSVLINLATTNSYSAQLKLFNISYVTFLDLSISSQNCSDPTVVEIGNDVQYCQFQNVNFIGTSGNSATANSCFYGNNQSGTHHLTINNCDFNYGAYGVYLSSGSFTGTEDITVSNSTFKDFFHSAVNLSSRRRVFIQNNTFSSALSSSTSAITFANMDSTIVADANTIDLTHGNYGIYLASCNAHPSDGSKLTNNMISIRNSSTAIGIYAYYISDFLIANNSIYLLGSSSSTNNAALNFAGCSNIEIKNNILQHDGNGYAAVYQGSGQISSCNNNNFYVKTAAMIYQASVNYNTIEAWQSATGFDANSITVNPRFASSTNLRSTNAYLKGAGTYLSSVLLDVDGDTRSNPPTIGADEIFSGSITPLNGTYTIDPAGSGARNFISFSSAANALDSAGMDGAVVFLVSPGTYTEQIELIGIPGNDATNTIEFRSSTAIASDVVLAFNATVNKNYTLFVARNSGLILKHITIQSLNTTYGTALLFGQSIENFMADSCVFIGVNGTSINGSVLRINTYSFKNNVLSNSTIRNGSNSVYQYTTNNADVALTILNDSILDFKENGIYVNQFDTTAIKGNYFSSTVANSSTVGITIYSTNQMNIEHNVLSMLNANYGIFLNSSGGNGSRISNVINNAISIQQIGASIGIYAYFSKYVNVYNNSIYLLSTSASTSNAALNMGGGCSNINVKNNLFHHDGNGYAIVSQGAGQMSSCDNNNYYVKTASLVYQTSNVYNTLEAWTIASGFDSNSISVNARFPSSTNLRSTNAYLKGAGTYLSSVLLDLDSLTRNNPPTIGAYEILTGSITPLNGTYTIDPAGSGARNFISFSSAANALDSAGIDGPVVFLVSPGTYTEQIELIGIPGNNATNTIEFRSSTSNVADVVLAFNATVNKNYTLFMARNSGLILKHITIQSLNTTYGTAMLLGQSIENFIADSCAFIGVNGSGVNGAVVRVNTHSLKNNVLSHSTIRNGSFGVYQYTTNPLDAALSLLNDTIIDFKDHGIYINEFDSAAVLRNYFSSNVSNSSTIGIGIYSTDQLNLEGNVLVMLNAGTGIFLNSCGGNGSRISYLVNNAISMQQTGACNGIYAYFSQYINIYHNSIYTASNTSTGSYAAMNLLYGSGQINVVNNNVFQNGNNQALNINQTSIMGTMHHNNLFSSGNRLATVGNTVYTNLADFADATTYGDSSLSYNPRFFSPTDLHTNYAYLSNAGTQLTDVLFDIDNEARSATPCLGADEFVASPLTPMAGVYTIDTAGSGARNFYSFHQAIESLDSLGISASVIFKVASGTYSENFFLGEIVGSSSANTIRFTSETNNKQDVIIEHTASSSNDNFVVGLNKTKYIEFANLTFKALGTNYARVFVLNNDVRFVTIDSATVQGAVSSGTNKNLVHATIAYDTAICFTNTKFVGGGTAISLSSSTNSNSIQVKNDTFESFSNYAISLTGMKNIEIVSSLFSSNSNATSTAIYSTGNYNSLTISSNIINLTQGDFGISLSNANGGASNRGLISNNQIAILDNGTSIGIHLYFSAYLDIYNNSILITSTTQSTSSAAIFFSSGLDHLNVMNNIFANTGGGYAAVYTLAAIDSCNNNNYYTATHRFIYSTTNYTDLAGWNAFSGLDNQSISINPQYFSNTDLRTTNYFLANKGKSLAQVPNDCFGNLRNNPPCIGMYEFTSAPIVPMAGIYTINPLGSGATNFISFNAAVNALDSAGIGGDVFFDVSDGTYTEHIELKQIFGSDKGYTIVFRSLASNKDSVILNYTASSSSDNYVVKLNNVQNIVFQDLTLKSLNNTYQRVIEFIGSVKNITVERANVQSSLISTSSSTNAVLIYGNALSNDSNIVIRNTVISNGGTAINLINTGAIGGGLILEYDSISNIGYRLISLTQMGNPTVRYMQLLPANLAGIGINNATAILFNECTNLRVHHNNIALNGASYGISINNCSASASNKSLVYNNTISAISTSSLYPILSYYSNYLAITNNSVFMNSVSTGGNAFYCIGNVTDSLYCENNIFYNEGNGKAVYILNPSSVNKFDYNNLYSNGTDVAQVISTAYNYSGFQALGFEANGLNLDPGYTSYSDLHASTTDLYNAGNPVYKSYITDDMDGDLRSASGICIGADEFTPAFSNDVALYQVISPKTECGLGIEPVIVKLKNFGNSAEDTIPVYYQINGGTVVADTFFGSLGPNAEVTFTFGDSLNLTGISSYTFTTFTGLSTDVNDANDTFHAAYSNFAAWSTSISADTNICLGSQVLLQATGANYYAWSNGRNTSTNNVYVYANATYSVKMTNLLGCEKFDTVRIYTYQNPSLSLASSPNYTNNYVNPLIGSTQTEFKFLVKYSHPSNNPPANGFPLLQIDRNNNFVFDDFTDFAIGLAEVDVQDTVYTNGKLYEATTTLPEYELYKTRFSATDIHGCLVNSSYKNEPIVDDDLVDLRIWANDIKFSNINPDVDEVISVSAKIHNTSYYGSGNFKVALYSEDSLIATTEVEDIAGKSDTTIVWYISFDHEEFFPMKVVVDTLNQVYEDNENNNFAIRPVLVGDFVLDAGIAMNTGFSNETVCKSRTFNFIGMANYTDVNALDTRVQGATVEFVIDQTNASYSGYTNYFGMVSVGILAPNVPGTYTISGTISDYTLIRTFKDTFVVVDCYNPYDIAANIQIDSSILVLGDSSMGYIQFTNVGDSVMYDVKCKAYNSYQQTYIDTTITELQVDSSVSFSFMQVFNTLGYFTATAIADYSNKYVENFEANNYFSDKVLVLPPKPDIVPAASASYYADLTNPFNFSYTVHNIGGYGTGKFYIEVIDSSASGETTLFVDSLLNIPRNSYQTLQRTVSLSTTCHKIIIKADTNIINYGWVDEWSELNNVASFTVCHQSPVYSPDLTTFNGYLNVQPVEPENVGDTLFLGSTIFNLGNADIANGDTIYLQYEVYLEEVLDTIIKDQIISGLEYGESKNSIVQYQVPPHGNNLLKIRIDNPDSIAESNELNNQAQFPLCWDFEIDHYAISPAKEHYYVGDAIDFIYSYQNKGLYSGSNVKVRIFADDSLIRTQNLPYIAPTGRNYQTYTDFFPLLNSYRHAFPDAGLHLIRYIIDADSSYIECNELNNMDSMYIFIEEEQADLRILAQHISPTELNPDVSEAVSIYLNYENIGSITSDSFAVRCTVNDTAVGSLVRVPGLEPGEDTTILVDATWFDPNSGTSIIRGYVDYDNEIVESDELNNVASRAIIVGDNVSNLRIIDAYLNPDACTFGKLVIDGFALVVNDGDAFNSGDVRLDLLTYHKAGRISVLLGIETNVDFPTGDTVLVKFDAVLPVGYVLSGAGDQALLATVYNVSKLEYDIYDNSYGRVLCIQDFDIAVETKNISCYGDSSGYAIISTINGKEFEGNNFIYSLRKIGEEESFYVKPSESFEDTISGLGAGIYEIYVGNQGATAVDTFQIFESDSLQVSGIIDTVSCGGNISLTVIGGTPTDTTGNGILNIYHYDYTWYQVQDTVNVPIHFGKKLEKVGSGTYLVTVNDAYECSVSKSFDLDFKIGLIVDSTSTTNCTYRDTSGWTYLLQEGSNNRFSGIYDVDPNSTIGMVRVAPDSTAKKANGVDYAGRVFQMSTGDTAGVDTFRVRLYYTLGEIDSLIARNDSIDDVYDIRIHKYHGPNQNAILGDNSADPAYWSIHVPKVDTLEGILCFQIDVTEFSEFYASGNTNEPLADGIKLSAKVFMSGCYNSVSGSMKDGLRSLGLIPNDEPYTADANFTVVGDFANLSSSIVNTNFGNNTNIVDWVFVELRDEADTATVVASRAALLRKDGMVVDTNGISPVAFTEVIPGNYFVCIRHRNHLSVLTNSAVTLSAQITDTTDFTDTSGIATYGINAQRIASGVRMMWAGDANNNGIIKYNNASNDKNVVLLKVGLLNPNGVVSGYFKEDLNLDGEVKYNNSNNDKNVILLNIGLSNPNDVINQQDK